MAETFIVRRGDGDLAGERWPGDGPVIVLLHEGIADRRGWAAVAGQLTGAATVLAYDRRGYGQTAPPAGPYCDTDDLLAVLDQAGADQAWLVGASAGGGLALDAACTAAARVTGLVLLAPAVSGAPEPELDPLTRRFDELIDQAIAAGDLAAVNQLETSLWLDGPAGPQGRVTGAARQLALDMNEIILRNGAPEQAGPGGVRAWDHLDELRSSRHGRLRRS